jgi:hypothetical protein
VIAATFPSVCAEAARVGRENTGDGTLCDDRWAGIGQHVSVEEALRKAVGGSLVITRSGEK